MEAESAEYLAANSRPRTDRGLELTRRWAYFLDEAFRIPGTKRRFGWDPLIGIIPGLGDIVTGLTALFILIQAFRYRVPRIIKARMLLNILIDVGVGAIPLLGDIFDFAWKSNSMNFALLEKHAGSSAKPGVADWIFVLGTLAALLAIFTVPIVLLMLIADLLEKWIHAPLF